MSPRSIAVLCASVLLGASAVATTALGASAPPTPTVSLSVPSAQRDGVPYGTTVKLSGTILLNGKPDAHVALELQQSTYPFTKGLSDLQTTSSGAKGTYSFTVNPDRNTVYRLRSRAPCTRAP
jgi:hypothetical protein